MTGSKSVEPKAVAADEGEARWWMGSLTVIKASGEDTGGQLAVAEITERAGYEAPLHVHHREDEAFWILDGELTFEVGERRIEGRPGDFVFGPRGVPHRYTIGERDCRMLFIFTPAGFENFIRQTSDPATERSLPPSSAGEGLDFERIDQLAEAHGCEVFG